jgi:hypothetical protein
MEVVAGVKGGGADDRWCAFDCRCAAVESLCRPSAKLDSWRAAIEHADTPLRVAWRHGVGPRKLRRPGPSAGGAQHVPSQRRITRPVSCRQFSLWQVRPGTPLLECPQTRPKGPPARPPKELPLAGSVRTSLAATTRCRGSCSGCSTPNTHRCRARPCRSSTAQGRSSGAAR